MKHSFLIEIADASANADFRLESVSAPDDRVTYQRLVQLGKEGRLGEFVTEATRVTEEANPIRAALKSKH